MPDLPSGTITFLFTDIEGSTQQWERDRQAMATAVDRHLALLRTAIETNAGVLFKIVGDVPALVEIMSGVTAGPLIERKDTGTLTNT